MCSMREIARWSYPWFTTLGTGRMVFITLTKQHRYNYWLCGKRQEGDDEFNSVNFEVFKGLQSSDIQDSLWNEFETHSKVEK